MSKVADLLEKYDSNGVELFDLKKVCNIIRGNRVTKRDVKDFGDYPVISGGQSPMGYFDSYNRDANTITVAQYGAAGYVDFQKNKFWANDVCYSIIPFESIENKYLYYILKSKQDYIYSIRNTDAVPFSLPINTLYSIQIPLPHIKVQEEIVEILDSFTNLIDALNEELSLRQKQSEYYREKLYNELFDKTKEVELVKFDELGSITRGKRFVRDDIREKGQPCIHYGDMYTYYGVMADEAKTYLDRNFPKKMRYAKNGDVIIVGAGENNWDIGVGLAWLGEEPAAVHDACYIVKHNINPLFIAYYTRTSEYHQQLKKCVSEGKICSFSAEGLGKIVIPVPKDDAIQQSIVEKLDAFDSLISSLKEEIALRQKQYEYYREKLLTFN